MMLRKREEIRLSLWLEQEMRERFGSKRRAKEEILARYASFVYMGNGQYGFARAAEYYFGRRCPPSPPTMPTRRRCWRASPSRRATTRPVRRQRRGIAAPQKPDPGAHGREGLHVARPGDGARQAAAAAGRRAATRRSRSSRLPSSSTSSTSSSARTPTSASTICCRATSRCTRPWTRRVQRIASDALEHGLGALRAATPDAPEAWSRDRSSC